MLRASRFLCSLLLLVGLSALVAGCGPRYQAPLTLGSNTWIGYEPLYLARELGYYDGHNLRLVELGSTSQALDALRVGKLDMAAVTLDEALLLRQEGVPISVLWVLNISAGADTVIGQPEITSLEQLRGKRIGVEQTAVGAYMLDAALQRAHLTPKDVTIVPMPVDEHVVAWRNHSVDAVVTFDPARQMLLRAGGVELLNSKALPGEIVDVLVARQEALQCCSERIAALIAGQQQALRYLQEHRSDALRRMVPRQGVPVGDVEQALQGVELPDAEGNRTLMAGAQAPLAQSAIHLAEVMNARNLLRLPPEQARHLIDPRFVQGQ